MSDEKTDTINAAAEPETVTKAEYEALQQKHTALEESHKAVQRKLEAARRAGGETGALAAQVASIAEQNALILETLASAEIVDEPSRTKIQTTVAQAKARVAEAASADEKRRIAADALGAVFDGAGRSLEEFDSDPVFDPARRAWYIEHDYAKAVKLAGQEFTKKEVKVEPKVEPKKEDIDLQIERAVEKRLKEMGIKSVDKGGATAGEGELTHEDVVAMTPAQRLARVADLKKLYSK